MFTNYFSTIIQHFFHYTINIELYHSSIYRLLIIIVSQYSSDFSKEPSLSLSLTNVSLIKIPKHYFQHLLLSFHRMQFSHFILFFKFYRLFHRFYTNYLQISFLLLFQHHNSTNIRLLTSNDRHNAHLFSTLFVSQNILHTCCYPRHSLNHQLFFSNILHISSGTCILFSLHFLIHPDPQSEPFFITHKIIYTFRFSSLRVLHVDS